MPIGEPTRVIRLPIRLLDRLAPEAAELGITVQELIAQRLMPGSGKATVRSANVPVTVQRCQCAKPRRTGYGLCKECHLMT